MVVLFAAHAADAGWIALLDDQANRGAVFGLGSRRTVELLLECLNATLGDVCTAPATGAAIALPPMCGEACQAPRTGVIPRATKGQAKPEAFTAKMELVSTTRPKPSCTDSRGLCIVRLRMRRKGVASLNLAELAIIQAW